MLDGHGDHLGDPTNLSKKIIQPIESTERWAFYGPCRFTRIARCLKAT